MPSAMHELVIGKIDRDAPEALDHDHRLLVEVDAHDVGLAHLDAAEQLADGTTASEEWMLAAATSGSSGWNTK